MIKFTAKLLTSAASNAVIKEAQTRFGSNPKFPKDEAGVKALFESLDALVPTEAQGQGIGKQMYLYLLKGLYKTNPPEFVLGEDDFRVRPLMLNYFNAVTKGIIKGETANLDQYRSMEDLGNVVNPKEAPRETEPDGVVYTPMELKTIASGSKVLLTEGPWVVYKIPRGNSTKGHEAAHLLCDNPRHGVEWCVGRGAYSYLAAGDFYVFEYQGYSHYAISSDSNSLTIWNPADKPIYASSNTKEEKTKIPSMEAASKKIGVVFDVNQLSALPEDIRPLLEKLSKTEKAIRSFIPSSQYQAKDDKTSLYKILHATDPVAFIKDLNNLYSNRTTYIRAHAVLCEAISDKVHMDLSKTYEEMNLYCLTAYLEAIAAKGETRTPPELDSMLNKLMQQWMDGAV